MLNEGEPAGPDRPEMEESRTQPTETTQPATLSYLRDVAFTHFRVPKSCQDDDGGRSPDDPE